MVQTHPYWILGIMLVLAGLPLLVMCCTCYLKVSIVVNLLKGALGFNSGGTMAVEFALSISLVALIMHPIAVDSVEQLSALPPIALDKQPKVEDLKFLYPVFEPWRNFLLKHSGKKETRALMEIVEKSENKLPANSEQPQPQPINPDADKPTRVLFASFILSELRSAIVIGVMILFPFLILDLLIANTLTALGLTMVSPISIALPLKLLLFYGCDGWILITKTLFLSYK